MFFDSITTANPIVWLFLTVKIVKNQVFEHAVTEKIFYMKNILAPTNKAKKSAPIRHNIKFKICIFRNIDNLFLRAP